MVSQLLPHFLFSSEHVFANFSKCIFFGMNFLGVVSNLYSRYEALNSNKSFYNYKLTFSIICGQNSQLIRGSNLL